MTCYRTRTFRALLAKLPPDVQALARERFAAFVADPWAPPLHRKALQGRPPYEEVRVGYRYRAIFRPGNRDGDRDVYIWMWIGPREGLDTTIARLP